VFEHLGCRRTLGSHYGIESQMPGVGQDVGARKDNGGMSDPVGFAFPGKDDLPAVEIQERSCSKDSPKEFASRISSVVIRILPGAKGSTEPGRSQGINCTRPVGVAMVTGCLVFTTRRAMPLNCALALETVIVLIDQ
jgi:hypothetical protein